MPRPSNPDAADSVARKRFAADVATLTPTGILNADTTSSASTYTGGARADGVLPSSTQRGLVPSVKNMRISYPPAVPHLGGDSSSYAPEPAPNAAEAEAVKKMHRADAAHRSASLSFDLTECSAPLANMLRRLIITEVPTMAIDRVLIEENDSPVPDEMISHRLGLCPIVCPDPDTAFEYVTEHGHVSFTNPDEFRVLCFELDVSVPLDAPIHAVRNVWSSELKWTPLKGQAERLQAHRAKVDPEDPFAVASSSGAVDAAAAAAAGAAPDVVRVVHPDVLLCKLGCGQRLKLKAYAIKGLGAAHAKWSPVAACHYDMQTRVRFERPLSGDLAARLCKLCPGVFEPAATPDFGPGAGGDVAVRKEAKFRDCGRLFDDKGEDLLPYVRVEKVKDEMRFTLESLGQYRCPTQIVRIALRGFANRLRYLRESVRGAGVKNASVFERLAAEGDEA